MSRKQSNHYVLDSLMRICDVETPWNDMSGHVTTNYAVYEYGRHMTFDGRGTQHVLLTRSWTFGREEMTISFFKNSNDLIYYVVQRLQEETTQHSGTTIYTHGNLFHDVLRAQTHIKHNVKPWKDDERKVHSKH